MTLFDAIMIVMCFMTLCSTPCIPVLRMPGLIFCITFDLTLTERVETPYLLQSRSLEGCLDQVYSKNCSLRITNTYKQS